MDPRVLITGIQGFTGRFVAQELAAHGWEVWGVGHQPGPDDPRYRQLDINDADRVHRIVQELRPRVVVHLAGIAFVGHGSPEAFYRVNLVGTRNLLAALAAVQARPECVVLASSANIYGNAAGGLLPEDRTPNPVNDYAVSKLAMEFMARLWMDRLPIVIARPFNYTGIGQSEDFLLPKIVAHFRRGADVIELGNLDVARDFSDVRSVAMIYRRLVETCPAGEAVNICSGRTKSLAEVLEMARQITGRAIRVKVNPAFVRANEVKTLAGDPSKLQSLIGDWPHIPLADTLRWMLESPS